MCELKKEGKLEDSLMNLDLKLNIYTYNVCIYIYLYIGMYNI